MNVRLIKDAGFVASGALFGALGAYYATKRVLEKEYAENLEKETENLHGYLDTTRAELDELTRKIEIYEGAGLSFETACAIYEKNLARERKASEKIEEDIKNDISKACNYVSYSKVYEEGKQGEAQEDSGDSTDPEVIEVKTDETDDDAPYIISNEAFADDHEEYRKVSATYYTEDKVLCEASHNEKIPVESVGKDNLDIFMANDWDLLYVRNDYLGADYEIDKYEGSYTYEVLGEESLEED